KLIRSTWSMPASTALARLSAARQWAVVSFQHDATRAPRREFPHCCTTRGRDSSQESRQKCPPVIVSGGPLTGNAGLETVRVGRPHGVTGWCDLAPPRCIECKVSVHVDQPVQQRAAGEPKFLELGFSWRVARTSAGRLGSPPTPARSKEQAGT